MSEPAKYRVVETPAKYVNSGKLYLLELQSDQEDQGLEVGNVVEVQKCEEDC